jgi:hypothetical protein
MVKKFFGKDEGQVETWFRHFAGVVGFCSRWFTGLLPLGRSQECDKI